MFYGSAEGLKEYLSSRGKKLSDELTDDNINSALLIASEWLDGRFESVWIGYKTDGYKQERSWPRTTAVVQVFPYYVYHTDEIPEQVVKATYEAAYREINSAGCLQTDYTPTPYQSVSVDGAVSVTYNQLVTSAGDAQLQIPVIESLMDTLIDQEKAGSLSSLSGKVVRV